MPALPSLLLLLACTKAPSTTAAADAPPPPSDVGEEPATLSTGAPATGPALVGTAPVGPAAPGSGPDAPAADKPPPPKVAPDGGSLLVPIPVQPAPAGLSPTPAEAQLSALVTELVDAPDADARLALLQTRAPDLRLTLAQARQVLAAFETDAAKVRAAAVIGGHLVDGADGAILAEELDGEDARAELRALFE